MSLGKIGVISMINKEETMEKVKQLWATVLAHKKISIAVAQIVIVLLILY